MLLLQILESVLGGEADVVAPPDPAEVSLSFDNYENELSFLHFRKYR